jgi:hypothetical protein
VRVLFLNQYFPPDPAPTGILLAQIGDALREAGHAVAYAAATQDYHVRRRGGRRLVRELGGLCQILRKGLAAKRPDVVFSATSPPCLLAVATLIAKRHGAKSVHWAMDLYPELASTLGEIPPSAASAAGRVMKWAYRHTDLVAGLDADMVERLLHHHGVHAEAIRPWILWNPTTPPAGPLPLPAEPTWLYSGNLGRAHEWRTLLDAQAVLEARDGAARLIFQGDGPSREPAQAYAKELGLERCDWLPYAAEADLTGSLLRARVLVATQRPETQGLLWPSKLALLQRLPRPLLWVGPLDGAVAADLRDRPETGLFAPGEATAIADWLERRFRENPGAAVAPASLGTGRAEGVLWWTRRLTRLAEAG